MDITSNDINENTFNFELNAYGVLLDIRWSTAPFWLLWWEYFAKNLDYCNNL